jgi:hypothetical protein
MDLRQNKSFPNWKMGVVVSLHQMQMNIVGNTEDSRSEGILATPQWNPRLKPTESITTLTRLSATKEKDNSNVYTKESTEELVNRQLTEQDLGFTSMENRWQQYVQQKDYDSEANNSLTDIGMLESDTDGDIEWMKEITEKNSKNRLTGKTMNLNQDQETEEYENYHVPDKLGGEWETDQTTPGVGKGEESRQGKTSDQRSN